MYEKVATVTVSLGQGERGPDRDSSYFPRNEFLRDVVIVHMMHMWDVFH